MPARNFAGFVMGFHFSSTGSTLDQYQYRLQMEEGRGNWIAPVTFNQYGMNAYKIMTSGGFAKRAQAPSTAIDLAAKGVSTEQGITLDALSQQNPELGAIAREVWGALQSVKR